MFVHLPQGLIVCFQEMLVNTFLKCILIINIKTLWFHSFKFDKNFNNSWINFICTPVQYYTPFNIHQALHGWRIKLIGPREDKIEIKSAMTLTFDLFAHTLPTSIFSVKSDQDYVKGEDFTTCIVLKKRFCFWLKSLHTQIHPLYVIL